MKSAILLLGVVALWCCGNGEALALFGTPCGTQICKRDQYCAKIHTNCESCVPICDKSSHNFEQSECLRSCQDYLLELSFNQTYARKETVQSLQKTVTVTLVFDIIVLILIVSGVVAALVFYKCKNHGCSISDFKKNSFFKKSDNQTNRTTAERPSDLPVVITNQHFNSHHSDVSPMTLSTSITRKPAEDSTDDYVYENKAMDTPSPNHTSQHGGRF